MMTWVDFCENVFEFAKEATNLYLFVLRFGKGATPPWLGIEFINILCRICLVYISRHKKFEQIIDPFILIFHLWCVRVCAPKII